MTEREKFAKEYSLHAGISVESIKFDDYGTPYIDTPYVTNVIPNTMVQTAYWGWKTAMKAAVPEGYSLVSDELLSEFPELNQSNYGQDEIDALNQWGIDVVKSAAKDVKE